MWRKFWKIIGKFVWKEEESNMGQILEFLLSNERGID